MKKLIAILIICLILVGCTKIPVYKVDAEVLQVNNNILEGQLIGHFLGSSSGWLKTDRAKISVSFKIGERLFLEDLDVDNAVISYYAESKTIPLRIEDYGSYIYIYLHDKKLKGVYINQG